MYETQGGRWVKPVIECRKHNWTSQHNNAACLSSYQSSDGFHGEPMTVLTQRAQERSRKFTSPGYLLLLSICTIVNSSDDKIKDFPSGHDIRRFIAALLGRAPLVIQLMQSSTTASQLRSAFECIEGRKSGKAPVFSLDLMLLCQMLSVLVYSEMTGNNAGCLW